MDSDGQLRSLEGQPRSDDGPPRLHEGQPRSDAGPPRLHEGQPRSLEEGQAGPSSGLPGIGGNAAFQLFVFICIYPYI